MKAFLKPFQRGTTAVRMIPRARFASQRQIRLASSTAVTKDYGKRTVIVTGSARGM